MVIAPTKAAQAFENVRENVRKYAWVMDMDIKSYFDEVNHELLMKALNKHVPEKWVKMWSGGSKAIGNARQEN